MTRHKIAILGASGYTGAELVRLIATHPEMEIVALRWPRCSRICAIWRCRAW